MQMLCNLFVVLIYDTCNTPSWYLLCLLSYHKCTVVETLIQNNYLGCA